jgi:hypothetical protein
MLRIHGIEEIQALEIEDSGLCPVGVDVSLENSGPDALELSSLESAKLGLSLLVAKNGATSELVRVEQPVRVDPAERCPCPDETKLYPGFIARRSLADAICAKEWLLIPFPVLDDAAHGDSFLFIEARLGETAVRRAVKPKRRGNVWFF